jgi:hypothetical protein
MPPVAVRPYSYTHDQKLELECQCARMLQQGVIRPSSSVLDAGSLGEETRQGLAILR